MAPGMSLPPQIARSIIQAGITKHSTRLDVILLKAFMAGLLLSFGGLLAEIVAGGSPSLAASNPGLVRILAGLVFPVGLVMIVLQGQELLTSNMMVLPMAAIKRVIPWWAVPYNWFFVFWGNLAGSLFFGAILVKYSGVVSVNPYLTYIQQAAITRAVTPAWHQIFLRGIGCNWLLCVAVWQAAGAEDVMSKILAAWFPVWVFVSCSFDHIVANMYSVPLGIMLGADLTVAGYIRKSLLASFFGNIVGALCVALPFTYIYLADYRAGGLEDIEEGHTLANGRGTTNLGGGRLSTEGSLVDAKGS